MNILKDAKTLKNLILIIMKAPIFRGRSINSAINMSEIRIPKAITWMVFWVGASGCVLRPPHYPQ